MKSHIVAHQAGQALLRAEIGGTLRQKWQNLAMPGGGGMGSMGGMDGMGGGHSARISIEAIRTQAKSHYLLVLAHATKCQSADCTVPECALTKTLLANHTRSCRAGEAWRPPRLEATLRGDCCACGSRAGGRFDVAARARAARRRVDAAGNVAAVAVSKLVHARRQRRWRGHHSSTTFAAEEVAPHRPCVPHHLCEP